MRITALSIENFRGVKNFRIDNLSDFVMIAGPNGCGKSCVFDAIRLLKSIYGGYAPNEWHHFFAELQIDLNRPSDIRRLYRDSTKPIVITATIQLGDSEREYLAQNAEAVLEAVLWMEIGGVDPYQMRFARRANMSMQAQSQLPAVSQQLDARLPGFRTKLQESTQSISITLTPNSPQIVAVPNDVVAALFTTYDPGHLGVIEYHSASRTYQREALGGIDLNVQNFEDQRRQSTLYNWQNKYSNIKSELAATYLRGLIAKEADQDTSISNVNDTIQELFRQFLPDKTYLGVTPEAGGTVSFPVQLGSGEVHDINELSSGEKELVYGYLRLRNSAPKESMILIDEPELHLNPGMLRGLVTFYHQNLGRAQDNQLWLVTHSDALLRQAVSDSRLSVFHMSPLHALEGDLENQASKVVAEDDLEKATIAIVGDLASYKPSARVVILEGGGDSEFDVDLVSTLAPEFAKRVNLISGGDKRRVRDLYETLERSGDQLGARGRFFAVVDSDFDEASTTHAQFLTWGVYHIENFLLEPQFVRLAVNAALRQDRYESDDAVDLALRDSASKVLNRIVYEKVRDSASRRIASSIDIKGNKDTDDPVRAISGSVTATFDRLDSVRADLEESDSLKQVGDMARSGLQAALDSGTWRDIFPGRRVLTQFALDVFGQQVSYSTLRNLIIDKMEDAAFSPPKMQPTIERILGVGVDV
ncbi:MULTISPECIES: ATP-binding protein [unclassified Pseudonocardia]|uniref:AAA family ATPase n=1 Tax=unclassified Pseudonocardia TaxID=2619320 RepID=UPI0003138BA2|nr:ATP-binding protein [Pseudonocardia sp. Ae707_Ps1]